MPEKYQVFDGFAKIEKRHYNRIVGVFTTGQDWEFKDWPGGVSVGALAFIWILTAPPPARAHLHNRGILEPC